MTLEYIKHLILDEKIPNLDDTSVVISTGGAETPEVGPPNVVISHGSMNTERGTSTLTWNQILVTVWENSTGSDIDDTDVEDTIYTRCKQIIEALQHHKVGDMVTPLVLHSISPITERDGSYSMAITFTYGETLF